MPSMKWAAYRETTRVEDKAYCLMGIFGVSMPLLYGEGDRAFIRLQEEILKCKSSSLIMWLLQVFYLTVRRSNRRPIHFRVEMSLGRSITLSTLRHAGFQPLVLRGCSTQTTSPGQIPS